jgi:hypothetical protein
MLAILTRLRHDPQATPRYDPHSTHTITVGTSAGAGTNTGVETPVPAFWRTPGLTIPELILVCFS